MRREIPQPAFGFTLIEVMVAIMILSISVVSVFGAQLSAVSTAEFAKYTTQAMQLARCRMSEIELEILVENGFEEADVETSGECCELLEGEDSIAPFQCSWEIKTVELPDISQMMTGSGEDDAGVGSGLDDLGMGMDDMDDGFGISSMISGFAPMIGEMLKQAMRRVTVKVEWEQGVRQREFILSQYIVHPSQGPLQFMHEATTAQEMMDEFAPLPDDSASRGGK